MERGEIRWASMPRPRGTEPGYLRPVVVVQADRLNRSRINTILCVAVYSNKLLAEAPGNVLLRRSDSGLRKDSVANVSQALPIDRSRIGEVVRTLPARVMNRIDDGLRLVLGLD